MNRGVKIELNLQMSKNAPCPCHSGKKYNACCIRSLTSEQERYYAFLNKQRIIKDKLMVWVISNLSSDELDDYAYLFNGKKFADYGESEERIFFLDWLFLEAKKDGRILIQFVLDDSPEIFDAIETAILKEWINNTYGGIFEVLSVHPDSWKFDLKEVFTEKEYGVFDRIASKNFVKGDIIYARLQKIFSKYYMSGVGSIIPKSQLVHLDSFIKGKIEEVKKRNPEITYEEFMASYGRMINEFEPVMPSLSNTAGEDVCLCEIEYSFDLGKIDDILSLFSDEKKYIIIDMDYLKSGFKSAEIACLTKKRKYSSGRNKTEISSRIISPDGDVIDTEGSITIKKNKLKIFADSKERAEKIRKMMDDSGYFKLEDESYLSGKDALNEAIKNKGKDEGKKKTREALEIEKLFFESYYKDWCRQRIPALGGITPKQALKTKDGKELLKKLLLDFENEEEHKRRDGKKFVSAVEIIKKELDFYDV